MVQQIVHYGFHFIVPLFIALLLYRQHWLRAYGILLLTMMVDIDHLLATPVYEACRCSIGFHLLHSYPAIGVYVLLLFFKPARLVAIGLVWHMATDYIDCLLQAVCCK
ncbi:DUF6122 family protein [Agriterribacter sp.]|uniref:DUF6122 family protein n=1 Tax=Agriterribacter sp. TaxID=2821509 RepID=UPI002D001EB3|nr:DUF6122 family protein [Agriterribacter sp.]HRO48500.1 DUF6122 family protein [Agriterribacter sp.]HRQ16571.1 DUF6122 family protein [Agriterribacter sp.]